MKPKRGLTYVLVAAAASVALVLGFPLTASAASWYGYYSGQSLQNQTHSSGTKSMSGGRAQSVNILTYARVTQVGIGSNDGNLAQMTHALTTTSSYCQWRSVDTFGTGYRTALDCWYQR